MKQKGLARHLKLYLSVLWIETNGTDSQKQLVNEVFQSDILTLESNGIPSELYHWVMNGIEEVRNLADIPKWAEEMPHNTKIGVIIDLVDNVLMPHWIEKLKKSPYFKFRKAYKAWLRFSMANGANRMDDVNHDFNDKFRSIFTNQ
jgi:hypothetical protein